jgi:hypothetical protein
VVSRRRGERGRASSLYADERVSRRGPPNPVVECDTSGGLSTSNARRVPSSRFGNDHYNES